MRKKTRAAMAALAASLALGLGGCGYATFQTADEGQYPNPRASQAFRDLFAQLEGTEHRITIARNRHIKTVQDDNVNVRSSPSNLTVMVFGYREKPTFAVENGASK